MKIIYTEHGDAILLEEGCHECNGKGSYQEENLTSTGTLIYSSVLCSTCKGTGIIPTESGATIIEFIKGEMT